MEYNTFVQIFEGLVSFEKMKEELDNYKPTDFRDLEERLNDFEYPNDELNVNYAIELMLTEIYGDEGFQEIESSVLFSQLDKKERKQHEAFYKHKPITRVKELWKKVEKMKKEATLTQEVNNDSRPR